MATINQRVCDVYGTSKDVKRYRLSMHELAPDDGGQLVPAEFTCDLDLCWRGCARAVGLLRRAAAPPKRRQTGLTAEAKVG